MLTERYDRTNERLPAYEACKRKLLLSFLNVSLLLIFVVVVLVCLSAFKLQFLLSICFVPFFFELPATLVVSSIVKEDASITKACSDTNENIGNESSEVLKSST